MKQMGVIIFALVMLIIMTGVATAEGIPAYWNIVQAGNRYDLITGSVVATADNRFAGNDATLPVVLNYAINVKPYTIASQGTSPAMGSVSSYTKGSINEGRSGYNYLGNNQAFASGNAFGGYSLNWAQVYDAFGNEPWNQTPSGPAGTFTYSESSSASGIITLFSKTMSYQSGKSLLP